MHRRSSHRALIYFTPLLCALAFVAFPAAASAAAPVNTAAPTITIPPGGASTEITNPTEGRTLTSTPGTWNPAQTKFVYQWTYNCTLPVPPTIAGNPGTSIPGATNAVYKVAHGDIGNTLCLTVSAGGSAPVIASNMTGVVAAGNPIDRVAPSVSGITNDGQTLTASPGTWDGTAPITFTYAWRECDSAGKNCGAVFTAPSASPTYVLQDRDLGHTMSVVVTASNSVLPAVALGSFATAGVVSPGNNAPPTISGTPQQGKTLTESHGIWVPGSPSYSYQWQVCDTSGATCSAIPGATSQTYKLGSSDVGHTVVVHEMATAGGVTSAPASSAASGLVQGLPSNNGGSNGGGSNGGGQNGGGSNGGGQPQGSSSFSSVKIHGLLMNALGARGKGANIRALLKHGGYSFSFAAPSAGRLQVLWYRLVHGRRLLVGTVTFTFRKAGSTKIEIRVTRTGRNLLRHAGKLRLTASAGFTPVGLGTTLASRTITLNG